MEPVIDYLATLPGFDYAIRFYYEINDEADLRTNYWPLIDSPCVPIGIVLGYLYIVLHGGPCVMKHFKTPNVKSFLIVYNSTVLVLNLILGVAFSWHIYWAKYQFSCQRVRTRGKHEDAIAELLWIFHCSKIFELIDTLFLILKKKEKQLTFLHMYHHSTIVVATWIGVRFVPGGSSAIIAMVNSWVHVFMYFYYEMMVFGVKQFVGYKKFVTIMQIVQFVATIVHCVSALKTNCQYPRWVLNWLVLYMLSFLVLFIQFYIQTYSKRPTAINGDNGADDPRNNRSATNGNGYHRIRANDLDIEDSNDEEEDSWENCNKSNKQNNTSDENETSTSSDSEQ